MREKNGKSAAEFQLNIFDYDLTSSMIIIDDIMS